MALDDQQLRRLEDPAFRESIVREALRMSESTGQALDREVAILGQAFLNQVEAVIPFEDLPADEETAIRDAVRTHLGRVRIGGVEIPRRRGVRLLMPSRYFEREQTNGIREFAALLQVDLFLEILQNKLLINRLMKELEATKVIVEKRSLDKLTRLPTRNYGAEKVRLKVEENPSKPLGVLLLDVDFFKKINDRYGHPAADKLLTHIAKIVREQIHMGDIALRYGGEEILIVLDVDNREQVLKVAQRLRLAIHSITRGQVTVSIGVEFAPGSEILAYMDAGSLDGESDESTGTPDLDEVIDGDSLDPVTDLPNGDPDIVLGTDRQGDESIGSESGPDDDAASMEPQDVDYPVDGDFSLESQSLDIDINGPATQRADAALLKAKGPKEDRTGRNRVWAAWKDEPEPRDWFELEESSNEA